MNLNITINLASILRESQNPNDCDRAVPSSIGDNSDNEDIQCRICDSLFESRRLLSQHKRLEHFPSWEGRNKEFCYVPYFVEPKRFNLLRGTLASGQSECDLCRKYSASVKQKMGPYLEGMDFSNFESFHLSSIIMAHICCLFRSSNEGEGKCERGKYL